MAPRTVVLSSFGLALALALAARAEAGEYHVGATLVCSDCHLTKLSRRSTGREVTYLLKVPASQLCQTCHDGRANAPDVVGANTSSYVREAGALSAGDGYDDWKGHTLGVDAVPPGGTGRMQLQCTSCHAPHGSPGYRNLTGPTITYAKGENDLTKDVFLRSFKVGNLAGNYGVASVDFNEPNLHDSAMSRFCAGCHLDFHGAAGSRNMGAQRGGPWVRHPTADASPRPTALRSHRFRVKLMSATGDWGAAGSLWDAPGGVSLSCVSCHKAHGNRNPFGLILLDGTGPLTEEGDASGIAHGAQSLCRQCHVD